MSIFIALDRCDGGFFNTIKINIQLVVVVKMCIVRVRECLENSRFFREIISASGARGYATYGISLGHFPMYGLA